MNKNSFHQHFYTQSHTRHSSPITWFEQKLSTPSSHTYCHKTKTSSSAILEGVWQFISPLSGSSEGVWQRITWPSGSSITIVQTGRGESVKLQDSRPPLSLRILCLQASSFSFDFSPSSFKSKLISVLEVERVKVGRGIGQEALRFASDLEIKALSLFDAVSMSFQCTALPGFLGVPELTLRVQAGFIWGEHCFLKQELISKLIPSVSLFILSWSAWSSSDNWVCVISKREWHSRSYLLLWHSSAISRAEMPSLEIKLGQVWCMFSNCWYYHHGYHSTVSLIKML